MSWELPDRISVREVGPRDGLQNEDPVPTDAKVALLDRLSVTGVQRIEAVSFVRPSAIPQMADADEVWKRAARVPSVRYSALVPNLRGALRALDAGFIELEAVVSASETHNRKNVNRSTGQSLDEIAEIISVAHERGATVQVIVSTAWGCPYEGDVPVDRTVSVAGRAIADGADSASFGDTTGMATPTRVRALVGAFRSAHPETALNLHFHNTRGTGLANVLAALELGVSDFDASVGGLGGCPYAPGATGNIATEELVHMVEDMGVATGIDLAAMIAAAAAAEGIVGRTLPSQVLRAGPRTRTIPSMTDFAELRETIERGGADRYHEAAAARGKLFARERIAALVNEGSFTEDGRYANALADGLPADGVVTGTATIAGGRWR